MFTPPLSPDPPVGLRRPRRRRSLLLRLVWWPALLLASASAWAAAPGEYQVKAALLFSFTKFVDWPPDSFSSAEEPITIAVLGRNPFGEGLKNLVQDRVVDGRRIVVHSLPSAAAAKADGVKFHLLFVAAGEEAQFEALVNAVPRLRALTVGESGRFAALGGMVSFVVVENRIRFEVNRAAAAAAEVRLRAQLQKLAVPARAASPGSLP